MHLPVRRRRIGRQLQLPVTLLNRTQDIRNTERRRMVQLLQMTQYLWPALLMMMTRVLVLGAQAHRQFHPI